MPSVAVLGHASVAGTRNISVAADSNSVRTSIAGLQDGGIDSGGSHGENEEVGKTHVGISRGLFGVCSFESEEVRATFTYFCDYTCFTHPPAAGSPTFDRCIIVRKMMVIWN